MSFFFPFNLLHAQIRLSWAKHGIGVLSEVMYYCRSKFLEIDQFTAPVSRNIEHVTAAKAEGVIQNLDFKGGKQQRSSTKKTSPFLCFS